MLITGRILVLLLLGNMLGPVAHASVSVVPTCTEVIESQITRPPLLPSPEAIGKRVNSAITCSEWSIINNGVSNWFTCRGGVNTCILGSSEAYWHCGVPQASQTWYTSCYDFPAVLHSGNNNYCPQSRPYCGTWSIITGKHTYSTFGCDKTKADKTLVRRSTITVTSTIATVTALVGDADLNTASDGTKDGGSIFLQHRNAAAVAGSLLGMLTAVAIAVAMWCYFKRAEKNQVEIRPVQKVALGANENDGSLRLEGKDQKEPIVTVRELDGNSVRSYTGRQAQSSKSSIISF